MEFKSDIVSNFMYPRRSASRCSSTSVLSTSLVTAAYTPPPELLM